MDGCWWDEQVGEKVMFKLESKPVTFQALDLLAILHHFFCFFVLSFCSGLVSLLLFSVLLFLTYYFCCFCFDCCSEKISSISFSCVYVFSPHECIPLERLYFSCFRHCLWPRFLCILTLIVVYTFQSFFGLFFTSAVNLIRCRLAYFINL